MTTDDIALRLAAAQLSKRMRPERTRWTETPNPPEVMYVRLDAGTRALLDQIADLVTEPVCDR